MSLFFCITTLYRKFKRDGFIYVPKYAMSFLLFAIYAIIVNVYTGAYQLYEESAVRYCFINYNISLVYILLIIENVNIRFSIEPLLYKLLNFIFGVALAVIVVQYLVDPYFFARKDLLAKITFLDSSTRLTSIFSWIGSNTYGVSLPFIYAYLLYKNASKKTFVIYILLGLVYALLTQTRYVILSVLIITLYSVFQNKKNTVRFIFFALVAYFILVNFGNSFFDFDAFISNRIFENDARSAESASSYGRILSYYAFLQAFPDSPIWGQGEALTRSLKIYLGDIPVIHIGYLQYLYAFGIFGMSLFVRAYYQLIKRLRMLSKATGNYSVLVGIVAYLVANTTFVWFRLFDFGFIVTYFILISQSKLASKVDEVETPELDVKATTKQRSIVWS
ncbi:hypothetical protein GCM10022210_13280 [Mucilaginibacter dorajii]|uniref:O-antigen ligase-related domain-containing protein n=1 Tax=Mucilaginibacter dorajii TaxID=692994 RepID=A0ABP7PIQ0_9SPHI